MPEVAHCYDCNSLDNRKFLFNLLPIWRTTPDFNLILQSFFKKEKPWQFKNLFKNKILQSETYWIYFQVSLLNLFIPFLNHTSQATLKDSFYLSVLLSSSWCLFVMHARRKKWKSTGFNLLSCEGPNFAFCGRKWEINLTSLFYTPL